MNGNQRWLILHCDDLGLADAVNAAAFHAFETGCLTSGSVMPTCPRFTEVVRYSQRHVNLDLGVHLTLTSEWSRYRWKPVADPARVRSLVDRDGHMWSDAESVLRYADADEIAYELRAQIDRVLDADITPTHLDSHMFVLLRSWPLFAIYSALGAQYSLPILVPFRHGRSPQVSARDCRWMPVDRYFAATPAWQAERWLQHYLECLDGVVPGINQMTVHLARGDREMMAIQAGHDMNGWNAAWRQRDLDVICSTPFRQRLHSASIALTTWREVSDRLSASSRDLSPAPVLTSADRVSDTLPDLTDADAGRCRDS